MIHGIHKFGVYDKKHHKFIALAVVMLPFLLLLYLGKFANVDLSTLGSAILISFYRLVLGYLLSLILGVSLAIWIGTSRFGDSVVPVLDIMQNMPSFALIPVFALIFGYTDLMIILFIATSIIWPIIFYVLSAIRTARTDLGEAATIFGAKGFKRILHFILPLSFPAIVTGSIVGVAIGWESVIGVEIIGFSSGIGIILNNASLTHNQNILITGIGLLLLLVLVINRLVWAPLLFKTRNYAE